MSSGVQAMRTEAPVCASCGAAIEFDARFCKQCGAPAPVTGLSRFTKVRQLYDQVLAVDPARRDSWLQQNCATDPSLLAELRGMLPRGEDSFLESPASIPPSLLPGSASPAKFVGPYRVIREIGRGGMGVVYLAIRDDGTFRKNVALKLLLREQVTPEFVQRFKQERQVLAAMDHPNIARILDGGDGPDGMPYYVMEYVDGLRINQYCDQQRLGLTARIRVFQQVCHAVSYLHQNSIVHRDLKPANILVSSDGIVKLLDFGIAKVVGAGAYANPDVTLAHGSPMTPDYASPEQIQGHTLQNTSDIYSLGAILYLLITGRPPYQSWLDKQAKVESRQDPPPPSTNIREDLRATPESTAQLRKAMLGELDSIVLMALRYEPKQRYQAATDLASDLQRFLDGQKVAAHHDTMTRRSMRIIRRKRMAIGALAGFLALSGFGVWQWRRAEVQKTEAAVRENQLKAQLEQLEMEAAPVKPASLKIQDVRKLRQIFEKEFPAVAAARPDESAEHQQLLNRGIRYLDRLAAERPSQADLGIELADAYQQMAVLQSNIGARVPARVLETYQKAATVLSGCAVTPGDTRIEQRLAVVRQRIEGLGGSLDPSAQPPDSLQEPRSSQTAVLPPARTTAATKLPPPDVPRPSEPSPVPVSADPPPPAAGQPVSGLSAAVLADLQERLTSVETRVGIAEQAIEPVKRNLQSQGQQLNPATLSDLTTMRIRLNQAKRQLAAGNEAGTRENLTAAQALADRVLKVVGR